MVAAIMYIRGIRNSSQPYTNLRMFIVYIDADQSLASFLGRSLKSATQVSIDATWQLNIFLQWKLVEWKLKNWVALSWVEIWSAFLQSALRHTDVHIY